MKGFGKHHMCTDSFTSLRERLVPVIEKCVKPDMFWLLGTPFWRRRTESINNEDVLTSQQASDNLGLLIRYPCMVSSKISDIFPRSTDQDKRLFNLLQKAYSDSRYEAEYHIRADDLFKILEKVRQLHRITEEVGLLAIKS